MKVKIKPLTYSIILCLVLLHSHSYGDGRPYLDICVKHKDRYAEGKNEYGFFAVMKIVLRIIACYEHDKESSEKYKGLTINFRENGLYYDPSMGKNWWNYYFEPVSIGDTTGDKITVWCPSPNFASQNQPFYKRSQRHQLVKKYFKPKSHVLDRVAETKQHFLPDHHVIGIHYRGTDKFIEEANPIAYQDVVRLIETEMSKQDLPCQLFIATDVQEFLELMIDLYPGKVLFQEDTKRSTTNDPVHLNTDAPYQRGLEALVDCLLLSECDQLIRSKSALSSFSLWFNPDIPCQVLNP